MYPVETGSLYLTLDRLNEAFFRGRALDRAQREAAARWIASRQGSPRPRSEMFELADGDYTVSFRLFTGEKIRTGLAIRNVLGAEACRALALLGVGDPKVLAALAQAERKMEARCFANGCYIGECAYSSVAYWRYLAVARPYEASLAPALAVLRDDRDGRGGWPSFPFYYALLALSEMKIPAAVDELRYAAPACERLLRRHSRAGAYDERRRLLLERALAVVN